jgi:acetolactate synthase-1/2/3 large subunit
MLAVQFIVDELIALGVEHVFGVGGANIEDLFSAVQRRRPAIRAILGKHEHAAGTAADAYARIRGLGVVMATSGGGALNLVHALAEARTSGDRVLAVIGEPPTDLQGNGAFQDTSGKGGSVDVRPVFEAAAGCCWRLEHAEDLPRIWCQALDRVLGRSPGPAVLLLAKDYQRADIGEAARMRDRTPVVASQVGVDEFERAASWLAKKPVFVIVGPEVTRSGARTELAALVDRLDAHVATTPDGRDGFDNRSPRFLGVAGAMGHAGVAAAIAEAALVVVAGTGLPLLARQGIEHLVQKKLLFIGTMEPFVSSAEMVHLRGEMPQLLNRLLMATSSTGAVRRSCSSQSPSDGPTTAIGPESLLTMSGAFRAIDRLLPDDTVVVVDAGNTGASAIHHIHAPSGGRFLVAMGMAGMGYAFGAAIGATFATGKRCVAIAGDGAFFMHGMDIHTAVEHELPITYIVANNRAHGMCLVRERLLLKENAGYNVFRASRLGAGVAAMFPGISAGDCASTADFADRFAAAMKETRPCFIGLDLPEVEVPPFVAFQERAPDARVVTREVDGG